MPDIYLSVWNPHGAATESAISSDISSTLWAFLEIESAGANSDTGDHPDRNLSLAGLFGTGFAAIVYIISTSIIQEIVANA